MKEADLMSTSSQLLKILGEKSQPVSGQELADQLNISRTAVWKAINNLKEAGYQITSQPRTGYFLEDNGYLDAGLISRYLPTNFNFPLEIHQTIDSTNIRAKQLANKPNLTTPYIIIANQQTNGYGRYGRNFTSPSQSGIYLSILLANEQTEFNPGLLTTAVALAMCRAIEKKLAASPKIKWVNDVVVDSKKVCGILTEGISNLETQSLSNIVVGAGINYLTADFPEEISQRAGSLRNYALKAKVSRNEFIAAYLEEFFKLYQTYQTGDFMPEYRAHSNIIGKEVIITQGTKSFQGNVVTIDDDGAIVLADGRKFTSGEVTKIRAN